MSLLSDLVKHEVEGHPIVLTTDRTLASSYNGNEFIGFAATFPKILPTFLYAPLFAPSLPHNRGVMKYGHCGSRKIEASLLNNGFDEDDVVIAHPEHLDKVIGPKTSALGITTHDPLGLGPSSTTFSSFVGGEPYSTIYFKKLVHDKLLRKNQVKTIVGGPGTWQLDDKRIMKKYRVNSIVIGEGEKVAPELFEKAVNGEKLPDRVDGEVVPTKEIPLIKGPTINGLVEISRGCGRGCDFCNPTLLNLRHRPVKDILKEAKINHAAGNDLIILHAEDVLRYGAKKLIPEPKKLMGLLRTVNRHVPRVGFSHFSLASVTAKPGLIEDISELFGIGTKNRPWLSAQVGVETGSKRLAKMHLRGKAKPFDVEEWPNVVREAFKILDDNDWIPCATLIMGMPGETGDDVMNTIELLDDINDADFFMVPLMFVPLGASRDKDFFSVEDMLPEHWQLLAECIKNDFSIASSMIDDFAKLDNIGSFKKYSFKLMKNYMKRRLQPHVKYMEQGLNPLEQ